METVALTSIPLPLSMHVSDATFVVTDTETTGTTPERDRILEIGAVKMKKGTVVDRYQQLVNPQRSVPGRITEITGITTGMVFDAPTIGEVLPEYLDFLGDGIFVAHNSSFDVNFINAECRRVGRNELTNPTLCTLRLARRLLPGLGSKGLDRLIQFYDLDGNDRHRALGDAEATSHVLQRFLRQLALEHEIDQVEEVVSFQRRRYQQLRETPSHLRKIREDVLPDVPNAPGVYELTNQNGTLLYVGKASALSDRVRSHFTAVESKSARKRKMLQKVRTIDWTVTDTELEAILLESRRITEKKPQYNRARRRYYRRPFLRLDTTHRYPTISWTRHVKVDGAEYYGPVRNGDHADMMVDVIGRFFQLRECDDQQLRLGQRCLYADMDRCTAPCETDDERTYAREVQRVRAFLTGQDSTVLNRLRQRMRRASDEHDFEKAADVRDTVEVLEGILEKQRLVAAPLHEHNVALVHSMPENGTGVDVLFVRFGRFEGSVPDRKLEGSAWRTVLREQCREVFDPGRPPPDVISKRDASEIRLLRHWMFSHREELTSIEWTSDRSPDVVADKLEDAVAPQINAPA